MQTASDSFPFCFQMERFRPNRPAADWDASSSPIGLTPFNEKFGSLPMRHTALPIWHKTEPVCHDSGPGPHPFFNRLFSFSAHSIAHFLVHVNSI